jgi:deoxyribonuclease V
MQPHPWNVSPREAREIQERLRGNVVTHDELGSVRYVAGIDVGFSDGGHRARAAVALLPLPGLELWEHAVAHMGTEFPYVPGLLSFREAPVAMEALLSLRQRPDLLLCDGQGVAHPRRFGLACHIGVLSGIPAIGVAKSRLIGVHAPLGNERGAWRPLLDGHEVVGAVLRTRTGVKPVYVSIGHKVSLSKALKFVLRCTPRYRLPETTRQAHRIASGIDPRQA